MKKPHLLILGISVIQGLWGIFNYGYMGQDFIEHSYWGTEPMFYWFNWRLPNSPEFYWIPKTLSTLVQILGRGRLDFFEPQAVLFLAINTWALFILWRLITRAIQSRPLQLSAFILCTFVPVRVIHSVVYAADAMTVLPFISLVALTEALLSGHRVSKYWKQACAWCSFGLLMKYSLIALLLPLSTIGWMRRKIELKPALWALAIPTLLFLFHMSMSYKHKSYTTTTHWKAPDSSSNMNWSDILLLKSTDCEVFQAPEYFHSNVLENHLHSYPALLHMATFTDPMNFFQEVPAEISRTPGSRTAQLFERTRTPMTWKLMKLSVWISLPLTLLCLWGIFFHLPDIFRTRNWLGFWLACALAYHGMMVMNFPRLAQPYYWGYWLPRYILPSVLTYLVFGIRAIDQKAPRLQKWVLVYSLGLAALWVAFL